MEDPTRFDAERRIEEISQAFATAGDALAKWAEEVMDAIVKFIEKVAEALKPILEALGDAAQVFYNLLWDEYLKEGAKYGETHEGMMHWLDDGVAEVQAAAQKEEEAAWNKELDEMRRARARRDD